MEVAGAPFLFNLSLMALAFATVSTLVMLLRQTMGGKLSNFDIYLISTYISFGFADGVVAILPPLIALFEPPISATWSLASLLAAVVLGGLILAALRRRRVIAGRGVPLGQATAFLVRGAGVIVLIANAIPSPFQGAGPFALGVTVSFAGLLYGFVRRVSSLLGERPGEDWDPTRG